MFMMFMTGSVYYVIRECDKDAVWLKTHDALFLILFISVKQHSEIQGQNNSIIVGYNEGYHTGHQR